VKKTMPNRIRDLHTTSIGDETVAVLPRSGRSVHLDRDATAVFSHCNGTTVTTEAVKALALELSLSGQQAQEVIQEQLVRLQAAGLLAPEIMPLQTRGLTSVDVGDELVAVTADGATALQLNRVAAIVFRACDGQTPVAEVAARVGENEAAEDAVWIALEELRQHHLLSGESALPKPLSRRRFLARWGAAAALLPVIGSLAIPGPAAALSGNCIAGGNAGCQGQYGTRFRIPSCVQCCASTCPCAVGSFCATFYTASGTSCLNDMLLNVVCIALPASGGGNQQMCGAARSNAGSGNNYICCECP
jgi:hypothetical protein